MFTICWALGLVLGLYEMNEKNTNKEAITLPCDDGHDDCYGTAEGEQGFGAGSLQSPP